MRSLFFVFVDTMSDSSPSSPSLTPMSLSPHVPRRIRDRKRRRVPSVTLDRDVRLRSAETTNKLLGYIASRLDELVSIRRARTDAQKEELEDVHMDDVSSDRQASSKVQTAPQVEAPPTTVMSTMTHSSSSSRNASTCDPAADADVSAVPNTLTLKEIGDMDPSEWREYFERTFNSKAQRQNKGETNALLWCLFFLRRVFLFAKLRTEKKLARDHVLTEQGQIRHVDPKALKKNCAMDWMKEFDLSFKKCKDKLPTWFAFSQHIESLDAIPTTAPENMAKFFTLADTFTPTLQRTLLNLLKRRHVDGRVMPMFDKKANTLVSKMYSQVFGNRLPVSALLMSILHKNQPKTEKTQHHVKIYLELVGWTE